MQDELVTQSFSMSNYLGVIFSPNLSGHLTMHDHNPVCCRNLPPLQSESYAYSKYYFDKNHREALGVQILIF